MSMGATSDVAATAGQERANAIAKIDHFVLLDTIGEGGMGEVYAAYDTQLDRKVAIKLVRKDSNPSARLEERLLREAKTLARVSHPNVVQVYAAGTYRGQVYIAMEFIRGTTLGTWLASTADLPRKQRHRTILEMFMAAGRGLEAAHRAGLVHRDFKPDNVLIGEERARVVDFGLARTVALDELESELSDLSESRGQDQNVKTPISGYDPTAMLVESIDVIGIDTPPPAPRAGTTRIMGRRKRGAVPQNRATVMIEDEPPDDLPDDRSDDPPDDLLDDSPDDLRISHLRGETADALPANTSDLTQAGMLLGTPSYMSPEQMRAEVADARSDQFSFCVALYEALCGERPFKGKSFVSLRNSVLKDEPRPPNNDLPAEVRRALTRGLARDSDDRFPDMGSLLDALDSRPRLRRRRRFITGGIIALLSVALLMLAIRRPNKANPCATVNADINHLWTPARQSALARAFEDSGYPYAPSVWTNTKPRIDSYVADLRTLKTAACQATQITKTRTDEHYDLQMICLEQGRDRLAALLRGMEGMTPDNADATIKSVVDIVSSLPEPAACQGTLVANGPAPAADPETRLLVEDIRRQLAEVEIRERMGRLAPALQLAEEQLQRTKSLDYPPVRAEALYHAARVYAAKGDAESVERASAMFMDAIDLAEGHRHDQLALDAWTAASELAIRRIRDEDRAQAWLRRAMAAVERNGDNPVARARVLRLRGRFHHHLQEDFSAAVEALKEAVALLEKDSKGASWQLAVALGDLANSLGLMGRHEEATKDYQRAINILTALFGSHSPYLAKLEKDMGAYLIYSGHLDEAHKFLRSAVQHYMDSYGEEHLDLGFVYDNLALVEQRRGRLDMARTYALESQQIYEDKMPAGDARQARPHTMLGNLALVENDYELALQHYQQAVAIVSQAQNKEESFLAVNQINIAESLVALGRFEEALAPLDQADITLAASDADFAEYQAFSHRVRGQVLLLQGHTDRAIAELQDSLHKLGDSRNDPRERAITLFTLARALVERDPMNQKQAIGLAKEARALYAEGDAGHGDLAAIDQWLQSIE